MSLISNNLPLTSVIKPNENFPKVVPSPLCAKIWKKKIYNKIAMQFAGRFFQVWPSRLFYKRAQRIREYRCFSQCSVVTWRFWHGVNVFRIFFYGCHLPSRKHMSQHFMEALVQKAYSKERKNLIWIPVLERNPRAWRKERVKNEQLTFCRFPENKNKAFPSFKITFTGQGRQSTNKQAILRRAWFSQRGNETGNTCNLLKVCVINSLINVFNSCCFNRVT